MATNTILLLVCLGWMIPFSSVFIFFLLHRAIRIFILQNAKASRAGRNYFPRNG